MRFFRSWIVRRPAVECEHSQCNSAWSDALLGAGVSVIYGTSSSRCAVVNGRARIGRCFARCSPSQRGTSEREELRPRTLVQDVAISSRILVVRSHRRLHCLLPQTGVVADQGARMFRLDVTVPFICKHRQLFRHSISFLPFFVPLTSPPSSTIFTPGFRKRRDFAGNPPHDVVASCLYISNLASWSVLFYSPIFSSVR